MIAVLALPAVRRAQRPRRRVRRRPGRRARADRPLPGRRPVRARRGGAGRRRPAARGRAAASASRSPVLAPLAVRRAGAAERGASTCTWPPLIGDVHLVTSVFFDIGVYLVVVGVVLDLLRSLGAEIDQHERGGPRAVAAGRPAASPGRGTLQGGGSMSSNLDPRDHRRRAVRRRGLPAAGADADPDPGRRAAGRQRRQPAASSSPPARRAGRRSSTPSDAADDERPAAAGDGADRDRDHPRARPRSCWPWPTAVWQLNGHDEVQDDVEDRRIVQLAEADLTSARRRATVLPTRTTGPTGRGGLRTSGERGRRRRDAAEEATDAISDGVEGRLVNNLLPLPVLLPLLGAGLAPGPRPSRPGPAGVSASVAADRGRGDRRDACSC